MATTASNDLVLVTGGSGFIGSHCLLQLVQKGYRVRTTVRSLSKADDVKAMLKHGGATEAQINSVEFCAADLLKDDGWNEAAQGCTYVLHVASPFPSKAPAHEDDLIVPAREGTLRALKAARAAGSVKRVVVTSSYAAIGYGHSDKSKTYDEKDWTDLKNPAANVSAYAKSKTIAERAAWEFIEQNGNTMELATINPVAVLGPLLSKDYATSVELVTRMLNGSMPAIPNVAFGLVDVRDVADLHIRAMSDTKAAGQRYLACVDGDFPYMKAIAAMLKSDLPEAEGRKIPTRTVPDFLLKMVALVDSQVAMITSELGKYKSGSNAKAKSELGWQPRDGKEALVACANSLKEFGLVK